MLRMTAGQVMLRVTAAWPQSNLLLKLPRPVSAGGVLRGFPGISGNSSLPDEKFASRCRTTS